MASSGGKGGSPGARPRPGERRGGGQLGLTSAPLGVIIQMTVRGGVLKLSDRTLPSAIANSTPPEYGLPHRFHESRSRASRSRVKVNSNHVSPPAASP